VADPNLVGTVVAEIIFLGAHESPDHLMLHLTIHLNLCDLECIEDAVAFTCCPDSYIVGRVKLFEEFKHVGYLFSSDGSYTWT